MAPPKASGWPAYIFNDPAVQTLDERGRFIICGVCAEYYITCGGKRPKPIVLNGCYRTRAWEVHKKRARAHNPNDNQPPILSVPASTANNWPPQQPSVAAFLWRPYESQPIDRRYERETDTRFNQPPLHDMRRSFRAPRCPSTPTRRPHHSVVPELFVRVSQHQSKLRTIPMPPWPTLPSTMVFPLVRTPADLRRRIDLIRTGGNNRSPGYDWTIGALLEQQQPTGS